MEWSEVPAYKQLAEHLRQKIRDEGLKPGDPLPSLSTLMKEHGVSVTVVRMALRDLRGEGLARSAPGKGNFVGNGQPETGSPEFGQVMQQLTVMQERIEQLTERLEQVESRVGVQPDPSAAPGHPASRRGRR